MAKFDDLISKFKEVKEELSKGDGMGMDPMACSEETEKADEENKSKGHSSFTMDHVNAVAKMPHKDAQQYAHKAVDESGANPNNKAKMKRMIMGSKSSAHLAQGMSNHILAHPSEGLKVAKGEECMKVAKNGQWSLDKVDPEENVNIAHPQVKARMAGDKQCPKCKASPCKCAN